jgi:anaerobic ribonucleoside-triphosphate reductase activating protein
MKISGIIKNDVVNGIGVCVSLFVQGCPHHCKGCFNPQTWSFSGGKEIENLTKTIIEAINANGVMRNFSILGGEPLCPENIPLVKNIIQEVRKKYPNIKIFLWTGYTLNQLDIKNNKDLKYILLNINYLIDGPFIEEQKDYSLWLRGSRNQRILKKGIDF